MLIAGTVGGAVWAVIPAIAKAYLNVNEIITTLMLDLAVVFWVDYWISVPWHYTQSQGGVLESRFIPQQAHLPAIAVAGGVDSGLAIAVLITLVVGIVLKYTIAGYRSQIVGAGQRVASFAGMRAKPTVIVTLLVGAALAGIGGVLQLIGNSYQLTPGLSNNTGYLGIAVAVVAGGTVAGIVAMSVLLAVIMSAGQVVQLYGVSSDDVFILIGLLLILSTIATVLNRYKLVRTSDLDDSSTTRDGKSTTKAVSIALSEGQEAGVAAGGAR
jgi:simple sugar transport system permease protein